MDLGLGLIAADEYFKEGDRRQVRNYEQAKRDAEVQALADKTAAERSGYTLRSAQNRANADLLPGQTANAQTRIGLEGANLKGEVQRQPTVDQTKGIQADMALSDAESAYNNQPRAQAIKTMQLQSEELVTADSLKQLPDKLSRAATQGVIDAQGQSDVVLGTMGALIQRQDKTSAINFANEIAKRGNILPNTNGKTFTDIVPVRKGTNGATSDGYNFVTGDGETRFVPVESILSATQKMKSGKYKFIERNDGSIWAGDEGTGRGGLVQAGDPAIARGKNAQHTPAEIQTMNWLIDNKVAKNPVNAWEMVRSAREKTRQAFIMDFVSKNAMPGQDGSKLAKDAGTVYDQVRQSEGPGLPAPSNTSPAGTMGSGTYTDPQIKSLLGLP